jgi:hypothetical protein
MTDEPPPSGRLTELADGTFAVWTDKTKTTRIADALRRQLTLLTVAVEQDRSVQFVIAGGHHLRRRDTTSPDIGVAHERVE